MKAQTLKRIRKNFNAAHSKQWTEIWEKKVDVEIQRLKQGRSSTDSSAEVCNEYPYFKTSKSDGVEMLIIIRDFVQNSGVLAHVEDLCQEIAEAIIDGRMTISDIGKGFRLLKRSYFNKVFDWKHAFLSMDISIFDGGLLPHEIIPSMWLDPFESLCLKEDEEECDRHKRQSEYVRRIAGAGTFKPMTFRPFSG